MSAKRKTKATVRYAAIAGSHVTDKQAKVIGRELDRLYEKHAAVTPKLVLDAARRPRSPLHSFFEWDDASAAERHRLSQAGGLIRSIRVVVERSGEPDRETRAFVSVVVGSAGRYYLPTIRALSDVELRKQVLDRALAELEAWRSRYSHLLEFASLFDEVDAARRRVKAA